MNSIVYKIILICILFFGLNLSVQSQCCQNPILAVTQSGECGSGMVEVCYSLAAGCTSGFAVLGYGQQSTSEELAVFNNGNTCQTISGLNLDENYVFEVKVVMTQCDPVVLVSPIEDFYVNSALDVQLNCKSKNFSTGELQSGNCSMTACVGDQISFHVIPSNWQSQNVTSISPNSGAGSNSIFIYAADVTDSGIYSFVYTDPITGCEVMQEFELKVEDCVPSCCQDGSIVVSAVGCEEITVCFEAEDAVEYCDGTIFEYNLFGGLTVISDYISAENCVSFIVDDPGITYNISGQVTGPNCDIYTYTPIQNWSFPSDCLPNCCGIAVTVNDVDCTSFEVCISGICEGDSYLINWTSGFDSGYEVVTGDGCYEVIGVDATFDYYLSIAPLVTVEDCSSNLNQVYNFPGDCQPICCYPEFEVSPLNCNNVQVCFDNVCADASLSIDVFTDDCILDYPTDLDFENQCVTFLGLDFNSSHEIVISYDSQEFGCMQQFIYPVVFPETCPVIVDPIDCKEVVVCYYGGDYSPGQVASQLDEIFQWADDNGCITWTDLDPCERHDIYVFTPHGVQLIEWTFDDEDCRDDCEDQDPSQKTTPRYIELNHTVYPNPFVESFNLEIPSSGDQRIVFELFDIQGQSVLSQSYDLKIGMNELNIRNLDRLQDGIYLYTYIIDGLVISGKLMKR